MRALCGNPRERHPGHTGVYRGKYPRYRRCARDLFFPSDIYKLADSFLKQDDITLIERKDYIQHPKESGYRSLHLIVQVPIFLQDTKKLVYVEVQFRTIAMDFWASLEHKMRYKKNIPENHVKYLQDELYDCARQSAELDNRMQNIRNLIAEEAEEEECDTLAMLPMK